jgi:hypothetical protein
MIQMAVEEAIIAVRLLLTYRWASITPSFIRSFSFSSNIAAVWVDGHPSEAQSIHTR